MKGKRILANAGFVALDYGRRRVGVAVSECGLTIAFGLTTLIIRNLDDLFQQLEPILVERQPRAVILGLPLGLEGKPGPITGEILALSRHLENKGLSVILVDEALSSKKASDVLRHRRRRSRKEDVDRASAALLLQEYLDGLLPPLTDEDVQSLKFE